MEVLLNILKIVFLLGFLVLIHESGHFFVAKLCKVKVNEFAIGFGPTIFNKQGKETKYALRAIPLGGFVNLEGEESNSDDEHSFNKAPIFKRILIVMAGGLVNILFAIIAFWLLSASYVGTYNAWHNLQYFVTVMFEGIVQIFTGSVTINQMMGPVGISSVVSQTTSISDFIYTMCVISLSLGITNLLPFPPLDGGKIVLLIIEGIRRKPLSDKLNLAIQSTGFCVLTVLSLLVTYNDIMKL